MSAVRSAPDVSAKLALVGSGNDVATIMGLTKAAALAYLMFNLYTPPCFAAIGAIKREMNNAKWTWFAIAYQCGFAYVIALMVNQFGNAFTGNLNVVGLIFAVIALLAILYMLFIKKYKEANTLTEKVK